MEGNEMSNPDVDPSKPFYVRFEVPKEVAEAAYEALKTANDSGKIRKGTNEATKSIERGRAKLVLIAENVEPPEIVGQAVGLLVGSAAASIEEAGEAEELLNEIVAKLKEIVK